MEEEQDGPQNEGEHVIYGVPVRSPQGDDGVVEGIQLLTIEEEQDTGRVLEDSDVANFNIEEELALDREAVSLAEKVRRGAIVDILLSLTLLLNSFPVVFVLVLIPILGYHGASTLQLEHLICHLFYAPIMVFIRVLIILNSPTLTYLPLHLFAICIHTGLQYNLLRLIIFLCRSR
eukprot:TRINITY_DN1261_c0_g2_i4.p1 TRINITY_DN1261_c0_g2~~TRINITY_DN1261_c0_g2_i4.p1  ORF type:complete len:176 (+),score=18.09 TRINITY_DN1261_c0_g2_i4:38-565(+)